MKEITSTEFNELRNNGNVVVLFGSPWCPGCKMLKTAMGDREDDYENLDMYYVDGVDSSDLSNEFKINAVPYWVYLKDGEVKGKGFENNIEIIEDNLIKIYH